jgi:hypothetical protein
MDQGKGKGTLTEFIRALNSVRSSKTYARGALSEYFDIFIKDMEKFRLKDTKDKLDEKVVNSIEQFIPHRNEIIQLFLASFRYGNIIGIEQLLHRFFEGLIPYLYSLEAPAPWEPGDSDNFRFIIDELFLYCIASLLKYECFDPIYYLLNQHYFTGRRSEKESSSMINFAVFSHKLESLEQKEKHEKLKKGLLHADLLRKRSSGTGLTFKQIMQTDFLLLICDYLKFHNLMNWVPHSLFYLDDREGPFEIFAKSESPNYFDKLKVILNIKGKSNMDSFIKEFKGNTENIPWGYSGPFLKRLTNYDFLPKEPD